MQFWGYSDLMIKNGQKTFVNTGNNICHNLKPSAVLNLPKCSGEKTRTSICSFKLNSNLLLYWTSFCDLTLTSPLPVPCICFFPPVPLPLMFFWTGFYVCTVICIICYFHHRSIIGRLNFHFVAYRCNQVMFDRTPKTPVTLLLNLLIFS